MRALYWKRPTAKELEGTGLRPRDYAEPAIELWPELWPAFSLFNRHTTQWRTGMGGPIGLDYGVIHHAIDRMRLSDDDFDTVMDYIRVMESEALTIMHED